MSNNPFTKLKQGQKPFYTSIPQPYPTQPDSIIMAVTAMKQVVESLTGASGPTAAHAVTFTTIRDALVYGIDKKVLPPSILNPAARGLSQAQVLARMSLGVVR